MASKRDELRERVTEVRVGRGPQPSVRARMRERVQARRNPQRTINQLTFRDVDDFIRSVAEGVTFGFADEAAAGLNTVTGLGQGMDFASNLDVERQRQSEIPTGTRIAGNIAGGFLIPGGAAGAARLTAGVPGVAPVTRTLARATAPTRSARGTAGQGAAFGVLSGAGAAEGEPSARLQDALLGGAAGGAIGGALGVAGRAVSPRVSADVADLQARGVTPTGGQIFGGMADTIEQQVQGTLPILGSAVRGGRQRALQEFNTAAANEALKPVGLAVPATVKPGRDTFNWMRTQLSKSYNDLLDPITEIRADAQFADDIASAARQTRLFSDATIDEFQKRTDALMSRLRNAERGGGAVDGKLAKEIVSELRGRIRKLRSPKNPQSDFDTAESLDLVRQAFTDLIERRAPDDASRASLRNIDKAYAGLKNLQNAVIMANRTDQIFTPNQLSRAILQNEQNRARFASGSALMQELADRGQRVLGDTVPDSGTAGRTATAIGLGAGVPAAFIEPTTAAATGAGLLAASAPFTPFGQRATSAALTRRQGPIAQALSRIPPALTPGLVAGQSVRE